MITKLISSLILFVSTTWAGGGSVIGNGAGIVENNFQYAYQTLSVTITACVEQMKCEIAPSEIKILKKILGVLKINESNEKRLQFVSEKDYPDFFNTGEGQVHRIAKTGLTPDYPIFINIDLLYTSTGKPAFDYPTIISILTHELGHQTGEVDHSKLDIVGAKLKKVSQEYIKTYVAQMSQEQIEVTLLSQKYPYLASNLSIAWQGVGSALLTNELLKDLHCNGKASIAGVEIDNGHYTFLSNGSEDSLAKIGFGVWVHLSCYSEESGKFSTEIKDVEVEISKDLSLQVMSVHDL